MHDSEAASALSLVKMAVKRHICLNGSVFDPFSTRTGSVKRAESPSQSRPGSPRCCCADSLMEDAVGVALAEAASLLRQRQTWIQLASGLGVGVG